MEENAISADAELLIAALHGPAPTLWWKQATAPEGPISQAGMHRRTVTPPNGDTPPTTPQ
jgi:hypothetical protein